MQAAGTYGSTASPAANKNDTWFSGTGTVTAGIPNSSPVAAPQSVSTVEDTAKPITLTATDAESNPLTYSIVTGPAHGTLTGTPPNVTYTPALDYTGSDGFTFKANDGNLDSAPATISITVTATSTTTSSLTGNGSNALNVYPGEADGYEFTTVAGSGLIVSKLGFYDAPNGGSGTLGDGLLGSHQVSIWLKSSGALVATALVTPAEPLVGNFRCKTISPVTLAPNTSYVIAADYDGSGDRMQEGDNLAGWGINGMTIVGGRYGNAGGAMPTSGWSVMIGPIFEYTVSTPPPNNAPVWTTNPVTGANANENQSYSGTLAGLATDANGDTLNFTKVSGPAWLSVATNGTLSGTPLIGNVGANSFTVSVSDGIAAAVEATLNITVINTNDAPSGPRIPSPARTPPKTRLTAEALRAVPVMWMPERP